MRTWPCTANPNFEHCFAFVLKQLLFILGGWWPWGEGEETTSTTPTPATTTTTTTTTTEEDIPDSSSSGDGNSYCSCFGEKGESTAR